MQDRPIDIAPAMALNLGRISARTLDLFARIGQTPTGTYGEFLPSLQGIVGDLHSTRGLIIESNSVLAGHIDDVSTMVDFEYARFGIQTGGAEQVTLQATRDSDLRRYTVENPAFCLRYLPVGIQRLGSEGHLSALRTFLTDSMMPPLAT